MSDRQGIAFIDFDTCYVIGCPAPKIDPDFYYSWQIVDPKSDGMFITPMTRRVFDPVTGNDPIANRHWWHSVGSGYTGEQSEYVLVPSVAKAQCEYELSKVGIDSDGSTYRQVSRLETFSLMLAELKHHNLIE